jgi:hypothetical protein
MSNTTGDSNFPNDYCWESPLQIFTDVIETTWNELMTAEIVLLEWRKQPLGGLFHHFLVMHLKMHIASGLEDEDFYLRWDWRASSNADQVFDGNASQVSPKTSMKLEQFFMRP